MNLESRAKGCLVGLACGDAVGTTVEFCPRERIIHPLTEMIGGGKFKLERGQWTDDTSMALCLAESLLDCNGFDPKDQMQRYWHWASSGHNSSTGKAFGIGKHTIQSLFEFQRTQVAYSQNIDPKYSGNGSLMRLAPIPLFYFHQPEYLAEYARLSSKTTHASEECLQACEYFAQLLFNALSGRDKSDLFDFEQTKFDRLSVITSEQFKEKSADDIIGSGFVIESLEAALWAFWHTDNFKEAILKAANLGDDADTTAAICGQIAGAYYGIETIPENWLNWLYRREDIEKIALQLVRKPN